MEGAYVSVYPDRDSVNLIMDALRGIDLPFFPASELHCTIMYSPGSKPGHNFSLKDAKSKLVPKQRMEATITGSELWKDHRGENILVLKLVSSDLVQRNIFWTQQGLQYTFPVYSPHITLTEKMSDPKQLENLPTYKRIIDSILYQMKIVLYKEAIEDPNADKRVERRVLPNEVAKVKFPPVSSVPSLKLTLPVTRNKLTEEEEAELKLKGVNTRTKAIKTSK